MKKVYEKYKYEIIHFLVEIYPIVIMVIPTGLLINFLSNLIDIINNKEGNNYIHYYTTYGTYGVFIATLLLYITTIILLWYKYYKVFKPIKNLITLKKVKKESIDINISNIVLKYKETCIKINLLLIFTGLNFILALFLLYKPIMINKTDIFLFLFSSIFPLIILYFVFNKIFYKTLIFIGILIIAISLIDFINKNFFIICYFILFSSIPIFEYIFINSFQITSEENLEEKFK